MKPRRIPAVRIVQAIWVLGYSIGTITHTVDLFLGGTDVYSSFPVPLRLFWVLLTVLDPLVVGLILFRRHAGVVLGICVIVLDVGINATVYATIGGLSLFGLLCQASLGILILTTARPLSRWFSTSRKTHHPTTR
jgi:hypothetical protein